MKKKIWALGLVWLLLLGAAALADGGNWHESRIYGSVQLANYAGWCDGYQSVDGFGGHLERAQHGQQKTGLGQLWRIVDGRFQRRRKQRRDGSQLLRGGV